MQFYADEKLVKVYSSLNTIRALRFSASFHVVVSCSRFMLLSGFFVKTAANRLKT